MEGVALPRLEFSDVGQFFFWSCYSPVQFVMGRGHFHVDIVTDVSIKLYIISISIYFYISTKTAPWQETVILIWL